MADGTTLIPCPCGTVEVRLEGLPMASVFCHCEACRRLTQCPVFQGLPYAADKVTISRGADRVQEFARADGLKFTSRKCGACGAHLYHLNKGGAAVVSLNEVRRVSPGAVAPDAFKPSAHIYYGERVMDAGDALPKYAVMPVAFGGSGELMNNDGSPVEAAKE